MDFYIDKLTCECIIQVIYQFEALIDYTEIEII